MCLLIARISDAENTAENAENTCENTEPPDLSATFRGLKYADIIREWFRQTGGEPQRGERNSRLHQQKIHKSTIRYTMNALRRRTKLLLRYFSRTT